MKKDKHLIYYIFLTLFFALGLILIWSFGPNKMLQMISLIFLSISYAAIGIIHHLLNHDLVGKIVIEYALVAVLGIAAAFFIFQGGFGF